MGPRCQVSVRNCRVSSASAGPLSSFQVPIEVPVLFQRGHRTELPPGGGEVNEQLRSPIAGQQPVRLGKQRRLGAEPAGVGGRHQPLVRPRPGEQVRKPRGEPVVVERRRSRRRRFERRRALGAIEELRRLEHGGDDGGHAVRWHGIARLGVDIEHRPALVVVERPPPSSLPATPPRRLPHSRRRRRSGRSRHRRPGERRSQPGWPLPVPPYRDSGRRAGSRRCTPTRCRRSRATPHRGGKLAPIEGSTPVRSASVRPYSNRVSRRSGAGPGSALLAAAQSGDLSVLVLSAPPQPAPSSAASVAGKGETEATISSRARQDLPRWQTRAARAASLGPAHFAHSAGAFGEGRPRRCRFGRPPQGRGRPCLPKWPTAAETEIDPRRPALGPEFRGRLRRPPGHGEAVLLQQLLGTGAAGEGEYRIAGVHGTAETAAWSACGAVNAGTESTSKTLDIAATRSTRGAPASATSIASIAPCEKPTSATDVGAWRSMIVAIKACTARAPPSPQASAENRRAPDRCARAAAACSDPGATRRGRRPSRATAPPERRTARRALQRLRQRNQIVARRTPPVQDDDGAAPALVVAHARYARHLQSAPGLNLAGLGGRRDPRIAGSRRRGGQGTQQGLPTGKAGFARGVESQHGARGYAAFALRADPGRPRRRHWISAVTWSRAR